MSEGDAEPSVHATALVLGERGVLITGPSGSGKSRLAALLIGTAVRRGRFARLIGDDRVRLAVRGSRVLARGHPAVAGLIERRGEGIVSVPCEDACTIDRVVALVVESRPRLPTPEDGWTDLLGQRVPRLTLSAGLRDVDAADLLDRLLAGPKPNE